MDAYGRWIDTPWREMPSWLRALTLVVGIAAALVLDHAIGGVPGFLVGLVIALAVVGLVPAVWRTLQS